MNEDEKRRGQLVEEQDVTEDQGDVRDVGMVYSSGMTIRREVVMG